MFSKFIEKCIFPTGAMFNLLGLKNLTVLGDDFYLTIVNPYSGTEIANKKRQTC